MERQRDVTKRDGSIASLEKECGQSPTYQSRWAELDWKRLQVESDIQSTLFGDDPTDTTTELARVPDEPLNERSYKDRIQNLG